MFLKMRAQIYQKNTKEQDSEINFRRTQNSRRSVEQTDSFTSKESRLHSEGVTDLAGGPAGR